MFSQSIQRFAFSTSGSNGFGPSSIQSNIGELMVNTYSNASNFLSQGFVQNDQLSINVNTVGFNVIHGNAFPNPVSENLTVELNALDCSDVIIEVYDIMGKQQLAETKMSVNNGKHNYELNFGSIVSGIYFVRVFSAKNQFSQVFKVTKA
jgi:hypothetical protein